MHVGLIDSAPSFAVITGWTSRYDVRPDVLATHMTGNDMIYCKADITLPAILAGIIIATEYFTARQLDVWPRSVHLAFQPDDGRTRDEL
jgi:hypothetical protein